MWMPKHPSRSVPSRPAFWDNWVRVFEIFIGKKWRKPIKKTQCFFFVLQGVFLTKNRWNLKTKRCLITRSDAWFLMVVSIGWFQISTWEMVGNNQTSIENCCLGKNWRFCRFRFGIFRISATPEAVETARARAIQALWQEAMNESPPKREPFWKKHPASSSPMNFQGICDMLVFFGGGTFFVWGLWIFPTWIFETFCVAMGAQLAHAWKIPNIHFASENPTLTWDVF